MTKDKEECQHKWEYSHWEDATGKIYEGKYCRKCGLSEEKIEYTKNANKD